MPDKSEVGRLASAETKKEFGERLAAHTSLTSDEIQQLFPKKADRDELVELLRIVTSAANENAKRADLIDKIENVSGAVLKIASRFAGGLVA